MKLDIKTAGVESQGVKQVIEFGIGDVAVVIDILRNRLYSKPIQTLVQEYICNARDAMRESGSSQLIAITVPTSLSPVFKVRDFGNSISPQNYADVFVNYGASTKRVSDLQIGGFGIGAKSAWSYTDSFNVTTFIDGVRRDYVNHVGSCSQGEANLVNESETDELNGTEIQIPVEYEDIWKFKDAIFRATYFWQEECQLLGVHDDEIPSKIGIEIEEGVEIVKKSEINDLLGIASYNRTMIISLDGIPYAVDGYANCVLDVLDSEWTVVAHLSTGDIDVAASREQINYSEETQETLKEVVGHIYNALSRYIDNQIKFIDSVKSFFMTCRQLMGQFKKEYINDNVEYEEYKIYYNEIRSSIFSNVAIAEIDRKPNRYGYYSDSKRLQWRNKNTINLKHLGECVYYVDNKESRAKLNRRLKTAVENHGKITLIEAQEDACMSSVQQIIDDMKAMPISQVEMAEVEKRPTLKELGEVVVHHLYGDRRTRSRVKIDENSTIFVYVKMQKNEFPYIEGLSEFSQWIRKKYSNHKFCGLSSRSLKVAQKDPNFISFDEFLDKFETTDLMVDEIVFKDIKESDRNSVRLCRKIQHIKTEDLEFNDSIESFSKHFKDWTTHWDVPDWPKPIANKVIKECEDKKEQFLEDCCKFDSMLEKYPIVKKCVYDTITEEIVSDLVIYINAKNSLTKQQ